MYMMQETGIKIHLQQKKNALTQKQIFSAVLLCHHRRLLIEREKNPHSIIVFSVSFLFRSFPCLAFLTVYCIILYNLLIYVFILRFLRVVLMCLYYYFVTSRQVNLSPLTFSYFVLINVQFFPLLRDFISLLFSNYNFLFLILLLLSLLKYNIYLNQI